jgi:hypothetical protein
VAKSQDGGGFKALPTLTRVTKRQLTGFSAASFLRENTQNRRVFRNNARVRARIYLVLFTFRAALVSACRLGHESSGSACAEFRSLAIESTVSLLPVAQCTIFSVWVPTQDIRTKF